MNINTLIGKTLTACERLNEWEEVDRYNDTIVFKTTEGKTYRMFHSQDCCEAVSIEDINGDLQDLVGSPITMAEENTSAENPPDRPAPEYQDSFTWTFYRLATAKGYVVIRWYGESNGYYSESVDFDEFEGDMRLYK